MTGCCVMMEDLSIVVVEGGPKAHKRYRNLMLNRIKWAEDLEEVDDDEQEGARPLGIVTARSQPSSCSLMSFLSQPTRLCGCDSVEDLCSMTSGPPQ